MKDERFSELIASVKEGGAILRDEQAAARTFQLDPLDIAHSRGIRTHPKAVRSDVGHQPAHAAQLGAGPACAHRAGDGAPAGGRQTP